MWQGKQKELGTKIGNLKVSLSNTLLPMNLSLSNFYLVKNKDQLNIDCASVFCKMINYYEVLLNEKKLPNIIFAKTTLFYKTKLFVIFYFPSIATYLVNLKWLFSKYLIMMSSKHTSNNN